MPSISTDQGSLHYEVFGKGPTGRPAPRVSGFLGALAVHHGFPGQLRFAPTQLISGDLGSRAPDARATRSMILSTWWISSWSRWASPAHPWSGTAWVAPSRFSWRRGHPQRITRRRSISSPILGSSLRFFPRIFGLRPVGWIMYQESVAVPALVPPAGSQVLQRSELGRHDGSRCVARQAGGFLLEHRLPAQHRSPAHPGGHSRRRFLGMYGETRQRRRSRVRHASAGSACRRPLVQLFPDCGHFIMLDEPPVFMRQLRSFLNESPIR